MGTHIGTSGWSYEHWNGVLYPYNTPPWERLSHYVEQYKTVELNSSFYKWPTIAAFKSWRKRLPDRFLLSVKAPRQLTHGRRLYGPERWIDRITASWHELADKRAVLLVQLSPKFAFDLARLHYFLALVPPWIRLSFEFRHASWHREEVFSLLALHNAAYCIMSGAYLPCILRATASFVYIRMHGPDQQHLYAGSYPTVDLHWWSSRIREWEAQGKDVFVYFNNDGDGNAVTNASELMKILG